MAEMQDDIMFEQMDFGQDPKPKLKDSDRKRLDSIVVKMYEGGASEDEIRAIVEDFKSKYSVKPLVGQPVEKKPVIEKGREMAGVFGGEKAKVVAPVTGAAQGAMPTATRQSIQKSKAVGVAKKSQETILREVATNDDVIEKMVRNKRFEEQASQVGMPGSDMPQTQSAINATLMLPKEERAHDAPVTPEEIVAEKMDIEQDEGKARMLLREVIRYKPEKRKEVEKSVYSIDAVRRAQQDASGDARMEKINRNIEGLENGTLTYDVTTGRLVKPEGVVSSLFTGWRGKTQLFDDYSFFNNKSDEEIIAELEKRRASYDPDEPIPVPKHKMSELSQIVGGMPLKPLLAGGVVGAIPGAQAAAPFAAAGVGAVDFYKMGYAGSLQNIYYQLREEGKSETEALAIAREQAKKEAAIDAATGAAMTFMGTRFGAKPLNFSSGYTKAALTFLKGAGKEGGLQALAGGGAEALKNELAQRADIRRDADANVIAAMEGNFLMTVGMAAAARAGRGMATTNYRSLLHGLSKVDEGLLEANIQTEVNAGRITEDQANTIRNEVAGYKKVDSTIPENISEEARLEIQQKIEKRDALKQKMETQHESFHPAIKEKIKAIDEEINALAQQKNPKEKVPEEVKTAKKVIQDAIDDGRMTNVYAMMAQADPEGFMKFVADQSYGRTDTGVIHEAGSTESVMREQFGDAIVDHAKEMFPLQEKKSSVYVAMPEDVNKPDVVEIKSTETPPPVDDSGVPPVVEGGAKIHVERPGVELSHSGLQDVANEFSLPDVKTRDRVSDVQLRTDAEIQAKEWADKGEYAANIERLTQEAEKGKILTDKERVIMEQHLANVMGEARAIADKTSPEYAAKFAEISRLKKAGEKTRSEAGAALRISGQRSVPTDSPEDMIVAKEEAVGRDTTPEEKQQANKQFEKIDKAKKSLSAKGKEIADRIRALRPKTDAAQAQFFGLAVGIYDTALVTIAEAVEQGAKLADAIQRGVEYVKANGGFKNKQEEKNFSAYVKGQLTYDERLQAFKERTKSATEKLKQKTAQGDFEPEAKSILELDEEARRIRKEYRQAKYEFAQELQRDKLSNMPGYKKAFKKLVEFGGVPRTLMTILDFSGVLRQGIVPTITHPTVAAKAIPEMFKQTFSKERFDEWLADVKESPLYDIMDKSGLYVSDPNTLHLSGKEEDFMSANLLEKIPILKNIVKGSERAYVSFLNKMRVDLFKQGVEVFMNEGKTMHNSPELYEGLANFINNATGRGKLGPLEGSADFLNMVFFSPRLMASRMNMLGLTDAFTLGQKGFYSQLPKEVRIMAMKDMLKFIAFGVSVLGLSELAGAEVELDPRSTDFGKPKVGNTRYDIWGGFQPYVRLIAQVATGQTKSTSTGEVKDLTPRKRFDRVTSFLRGKLAPVPGSVLDVIAGENIIGEPTTLQSEALESVTPMIINDVGEAMKDQGMKALFTVGVPSIFGIGSTTYDSKQSTKEDGGSKRPSRERPKRPKRETRN